MSANSRGDDPSFAHFADAMAAMAKAAQDTVETLAPVLKDVQSAGELLAPVVKEIQRNYETLAPLIDSLAAIVRATPAPVVIRQISHRPIPFEKYLEDAQTVGEAGWMIPVSFTPRQLGIMAKAARDRGPEAVDPLVLEYYDAGDRKEFKRLQGQLLNNKHLAIWSTVLGDAVWSYHQGRYSLIIPAAFMVIEGMVAEIARQLQNSKATNAYITWEKRVPPPSGQVRLLLWTAITAFLRSTYSYAPFDQPPVIINRHAVHHGRLPTLNRQVDALRLLVAIACLAENRETLGPLE